MSGRLPYMPAFVQDWLDSETVAGMSMEAQGLYWRLLCLAWNRDGLTTNEAALQRLCGASEAEWRRSWPLVAPCWQEKHGRLYNDRLEEVRNAVEEGAVGITTEARRRGGRKSAETRRLRYGSAQPSSKPAPEVTSSDTTEVSSGALPRSHFEVTSASSAELPEVDLRSQNTDPSTTTDRDLRDRTRAQAAGASSSSVEPPLPLPGGQLAWLGLVEAWNRLGPGPDVSTATLHADSRRRLARAARDRALVEWERVFELASASDFLAGRLGDGRPPIDLWTAIEKADLIAAGRYRTYPKPTPPPEPRSVIPSTDETMAVIRDVRRQRAEIAAEKAAAQAGAPVPTGGPH